MKLENEQIVSVLLSLTKDEMNSEELKLFSDAVRDKAFFSRFFVLVCKHKLLTYLYFHLVHNQLLGSVETYYKVLLKNCCANIQAKNFYFHEEFLKLTDALTEAKAKYVCIKGISLNDRFYRNKNHCIRDYNDMDFLTTVDELEKIKKVLSDREFRQGTYDYETSEFLAASRRDLLFWRTFTHQIHPFVKQAPNFCFSSANLLKVDVNFSIFFGGNQNDPVSAEELLQNRIIWCSDELGNYPILAPEVEFIQLCNSFYKDTIYKEKQKGLSFCLSNLLDIERLVSNRALDYKWIEAYIKEKNIEKNIYEPLAFVTSIFDCKDLNNLMERHREFKTIQKKEIQNIMVLGEQFL